MENKDFRKTELEKGDTVIYITPYYRSLSEGTVLGFTPEMVTILPKDSTSSKYRVNRFKIDVIKIEK